MPRDGSNVYTKPFPDVAPATTIESAIYNGFVNDIATDANTPRAIVAGGTGATSAANARTNLAVVGKAGDTMTGALVLSGAPTIDLHAATKKYVDDADVLKAALASPVFTGNPTGPTAAPGDNDTSLATTAFVMAAIAASPIPAGTKMTFQQTAAPTGWTKDTTHNDKALRVVSGAASNGGSVAFSVAFGGTTTDATTLSIAQVPALTVPIITFRKNIDVALLNANASIGQGFWAGGSDFQENPSANYVTNGGGGQHTHPLDLRVRYVDVIIATKD